MLVCQELPQVGLATFLPPYAIWSVLAVATDMHLCELRLPTRLLQNFSTNTLSSVTRCSQNGSDCERTSYFSDAAKHAPKRPSTFSPYLVWQVVKTTRSYSLAEGAYRPWVVEKSRPLRPDGSFDEPSSTRASEHFGARRAKYSTVLCISFEGMGSRHRRSLLHLR